MPKRSLTYTIHGVDALNKRVLATVFAKKFAALLAGLKAADKDGNGSKHFDYVIADMRVSSAVVKLDTLETSKKQARVDPFEAFEECATALEKSDFDKALVYAGTVQKIAELSEGAGDQYSYADIDVGGNVIRIDDFLARQAENAKRHMEAAAEVFRHFVGVSHGSFDGEIKEVDLRGTQPQMKLRLSAGNKEIDCISKTIGIDEIRAALDRRVWVEGQAVYGGRSGLPERLEVTRITKVDDGRGVERWRGSFRKFDLLEWEGDL